MSMKLLLTEDVEALGRKGDIVTARPGYARNYLLPQGFAIVADKKALRMQARLQEERLKKALVDKQESEALKAKVDGITITTVVKVDHDGNMYGSVTAHDIVNLLNEQASVEIEKRFVHLKHPIKQIGDHPIHLKLKEGVDASLTIQVQAEENTNSISSKK